MRAALAMEGLARAGELWIAGVPVSDPGRDTRQMRWASERVAQIAVPAG
jgi:hypothetical protein